LHPEAVEQFKRAISLRRQDARAYDYLALNLEALDEVKKAEATYKKGLEVNQAPFFDFFLDYNYGRFLMKVNRLAESKVYLDRALRIAPETRAVYYEHSRLNLRLQKYKEARADAERALSLPDPSGFILDLQVYYLLATIHSRLGNTELAQKYAALCRTSRVPIPAQGRGDR
jgi:tetratricopeptide (TPR) repeat protein